MLSELYPFSPKKLKLSCGYEMSYVDEGEGEDIVLMVHGNPTWSFLYRNAILQLQDRFRCIVPDHIGCGFSEKPQDYAYRLQDHVDNLKELVDHINPKSIRLIVHDWGGAIGMAVAQEFVDQVERLVILNTAAFRSKKVPFRIGLCRTPFLGEFMMRAFNVFAVAATRMAVVNPMMRKVREGYLYPYDSWKNRVAIARFVKDIPLTPAHPSYKTLKGIEKKLPMLSEKPALICWGGQDFCFNDHFFRKWKKHLPKAESYYFSNAGHYLLEDKGEEVLEKVKQFL